MIDSFSRHFETEKFIEGFLEHLKKDDLITIIEGKERGGMSSFALREVFDGKKTKRTKKSG